MTQSYFLDYIVSNLPLEDFRKYGEDIAGVLSNDGAIHLFRRLLERENDGEVQLVIDQILMVVVGSRNDPMKFLEDLEAVCPGASVFIASRAG
ncbi:hypothetical protein [Pseudochelatococcus sp. G4_1912]|uniref:hypothetical protein n=1 Tax=Pseudochelatococcus sp. G4_1912 TaxID=3114288 RepID=UPI0039C6F01A